MRTFHFRDMIYIVSLASAAPMTPASAYEVGFSGWEQKPGITLGSGTASTPAPGIYMFNQFLTYQASIVGPGAPHLGGTETKVSTASASTGVLFAPGWTFLGATYNAVIVQPAITTSIGPPMNAQLNGLHNTYIVPAELSWKLGESGFFLKTGLGIYVPDGTVSGANGLGSIGNPWWTFQPELVVSYLKDGWNLTANIFAEINTRNTITGYTSGDLLHAEFTVAKTIGKWTFGPVAYYAGQVTDDKSSNFYNGAINVNRYNIYAAGARVGYDFGPVTLNVWALDEFHSDATGTTPTKGSVNNGFTVYASFNYRLWSPDPSTALKSPLIRK